MALMFGALIDSGSISETKPIFDTVFFLISAKSLSEVGMTSQY